jgi:hypothetical protein
VSSHVIIVHAGELGIGWGHNSQTTWLQLYLVEREEQAEPAMAALRQSMADSVVAIDLVRAR